MARIYGLFTLKVLKTIEENPGISPNFLFNRLKKTNQNYKDFYNLIFRLDRFGLIQKIKDSTKIKLTITLEGNKILNRYSPKKDGIWKLVIFDIPEKHKYVRTILRAKLKSLHFKKWQNSIWASPFALDEEIEEELNQLSKKYFIRLIKTTQINNLEDLIKLFN